MSPSTSLARFARGPRRWPARWLGLSPNLISRARVSNGIAPAFCAFLTAAIWTLSASARDSLGIELPDGVAWPENLEWHGIEGSARAIPTRFGRIDVAYEGDGLEGSVNTVRITLDGDLVVAPISRGADFGFVSIKEVFQLEDDDVVLIGATAGGSGSPPQQLVLLSLARDHAPHFLLDPELRSVDGTERVASDGERIYFDLGYDRERRKTASFEEDRIQVRYAAGRASPISERTCRELADAIDESCVSGQPLSQAVVRWLDRLDHRPGFEGRRVRSACESMNRTGEPQAYALFRTEACQLGSIAERGSPRAAHTTSPERPLSESVPNGAPSANTEHPTPHSEAVDRLQPR